MPKGSFCVCVFFFFLFVSANGRYQTVGPEGPAYLNQQAGCLLEDLQRKMFGAEGTMHAVHCLVRRATPRPCLPGASKVLAVLGAHCQGIAQPAGLGSSLPPLRPSDWGVKSTRTQGRISFSITGLNKLYPNPHQT